ncbi:MAG: hypothetical protein A3205_05675 [Methanomassiliicoccales archaeon Mx-03]|nr:MAG: hypothetical protein A3205_05675 [Methanomassiliicoccales archaeon Mx-03]
MRWKHDIILRNTAPASIEHLAWDLASFEEMFDTYGFRDDFDSIETAADAYRTLLLSGDAESFLSTLVGIGRIDYDLELERRRQDLIDRLGRLRWRIASSGRSVRNAGTRFGCRLIKPADAITVVRP